MWIRRYVPQICPVCKKSSIIEKRNNVSYAYHYNCYWYSKKYFITTKIVDTNPIKTPHLPCLTRFNKIEISYGCTHDCIYCYSYTRFVRGLVILKERLIEMVKKQLSIMPIVKPIYLSPNSDPFQEISIHITAHLVKLLIEKNLSFYFVTKGNVSKKILELIEGYPYVDIQITITTLDEEKRKLIEPHAPRIKARLNTIKKFVDIGLNPIVRIDPLLPYLTDDEDELNSIVKEVISLGARHIVASYLCITPLIFNFLKEAFIRAGFNNLIPKYVKLFDNKIYSYTIANSKYRYKKLKKISELIKIYGNSEIGFSTCLEGVLFKKLWLNTNLCTPIYLPVMKRQGDKFKPIKKCLLCIHRRCENCNNLTLGDSQILLNNLYYNIFNYEV